MSPDGSVSMLLTELRQGNQNAAGALWKRYGSALIRIAQRRLNCRYQVVNEPDEAAVDAFVSFCLRAADGRVRVYHRDELSRLLVSFTCRKVFDIVERENAKKRGGGSVLRETDMQGRQPGSDRDEILDTLESREVAPEVSAALNEAVERLFSWLADEELQRTAELRLDGCTEDEIAAQMVCSSRTVRRRLGLIRDVWRKRIEDEPYDWPR
jgi:DNA-directed RNA polymerase specialized sigma24 family protein